MNFKLKNYSSKSLNTNNYTHIRLDGGIKLKSGIYQCGKYYIEKKQNKKLFKFLAQNRHIPLCEKIPEIFPLFFDIDNLDENIKIDNIIIKLEEKLKKDIFKNISNKLKYILTQKKDESRYYHLFYPDIYIDKSIAINICNYINKIFSKDNKEVFDTLPYSRSLRIHGTLKYDKNKKERIYDSDHEIISHKFEENKLDSLEKQMKFLSMRKKDIKKITILKEEYKIYKECKKEIKNINMKMSDNKYKKNNDCKIIKDLLNNCLSVDYLDIYKNWCYIILLCENLNVDKEILIEWSKLSKHYNGNKWIDNNISKTYENNKYKYTNPFIELCKICKECNKDEYYKLVNRVSVDEKNLEDICSIEFLEKCLNGQDSGDAKLFAYLYNYPGKRIICITNSGKKKIQYYYWDGNLWIEDKSNIMINLSANQLSNCYTKYRNFVYNKIKELNEKENKEEKSEDIEFEKAKYNKLYKKVKERIEKCKTSKHFTAIMPYLTNKFYKEDFKSIINKNKDIISVKNGIIDLKTGQLRNKRIDDFISYELDVEFKGLNINVKIINTFFKEIMLEHNKEDIKCNLVKYLQVFLGYSITGHLTEQKFAIFWGEKGSNGKTVLIELLKNLLEEKKYYATLSGDALFKGNKMNPGSATPHLVPLWGSRIAILDESDKQVKLNEGMVKRISGSTSLTVRKLFEEEFTFENNCQTILVTNFRPEISNDTALHRRLILFPFNAQFKSENEFNLNNNCHLARDAKKLDKLKKCKEELLSWLVKGSIEWYKTGLPKEPEKIKAITEKYKILSDQLQVFLDNECIYNNENNIKYNYFTSVENMLDYYQNYTSDKSINIKEFKNMMEKKGFIVKNIKINNRKRRGYPIKIIQDYEDSEEE